MEALIDVVLGHLAECFYIALGIGLILYACLAKRFYFEGDVAVKPEDRQFYEATPKMRVYGFVLGMLPLLYGLYHLLYPIVMKGKSSNIPH